MSNVKNEEFKSDEISLKDAIIKITYIAKYLISKWYIILVITFAGGAYNYYNERQKIPLYKSHISFVLENGTSGGTGSDLGGLASQLGLGGGSISAGETFSGSNLQELMISRSMVQKALLMPVTVNGKKLSLADFLIEVKGFRKDWANTPLANLHFEPNVNPESFNLDHNRIMADLHSILITKDMTLSMQNKGLSTIDVFSENELFAKYFSEVLLEVVSDFYIATKTKKAFKNYAILKSQVDSMKRVLNKAVPNLAATVDANPNPNRARTILGATTQRRQIDIQANQAFYVQMIQNLESAKISLRKETPLIQVIDKPILPLFKKEGSVKSAFIIGAVIWSIVSMVALIVTKLLRDVLKS